MRDHFDRPPVRPPAVAPTHALGAHRRPRPLVLVIEDEEAMRQTYRDLLEDEGFGVLTAENGAEGLAKLDELDVSPALVVLDVGMPVIDGQQVLACLRARPEASDLPVVVVTGRREAVASLSALGVSVIRKPFDIASFLAKVTRATTSGTALLT